MTFVCLNSYPVWVQKSFCVQHSCTVFSAMDGSVSRSWARIFSVIIILHGPEHLWSDGEQPKKQVSVVFRVYLVLENPGRSWNWEKKIFRPWKVLVVVLENPEMRKKFLSIFPKIIKIFLIQQFCKTKLARKWPVIGCFLFSESASSVSRIITFVLKTMYKAFRF